MTHILSQMQTRRLSRDTRAIFDCKGSV